MLCQFTFKNFKSYRNETVFDMQAANIEEFSDTLIPPPCDHFSSLLPISVIYGPNAGGKSNLIDALAYLVSRILMPIKASTGNIGNPFGMFLTGYKPFLLDNTSKDEPTEFEIFFRTNNAQYQYNMSILRDVIVSESLYYVKIPCQRRRSVLLFERYNGIITLGSLLKKANCENVGATIPYLSFLSINYSFPEVEEAVKWFKNCCIINYASTDKDHSVSSLLLNTNIKNPVLDLLSAMDIPITDFEITEETENDGEKKRKLITTHTVKGQAFQLDLADESSGTVKILSALPAVLTSIITGGPLIVDELDAKLHPQLLRFLIQIYLSPEVNNSHAQLIFTCHDISIMKNDLLRRDEIWFVARDEDSSSEIWSLYDLRDPSGERVKNTAAYDRQYLAGRYGADPYLQRMMKWGEFDA